MPGIDDLVHELRPADGAPEGALVLLHGRGTSERDLVPLCGPATRWEDCCHSRKYFLGAARFWSALGIDPLDLAYRLWRVSGDVQAGEYLVLRARETR